MAEPNTSGASVVALVIASLGPVAGPYSLIVMASLAGAMWPLSTMPHTSRTQGALFLLRIVATAVLCTGSVAWVLAERFNLPIYEGMSIASFGIGALGNGWGKVFRGLRDGLAAVLRGIGDKAKDEP